MLPRKRIGDGSSKGYWKIPDVELSSLSTANPTTPKASSSVWVSLLPEEVETSPFSSSSPNQASTLRQWHYPGGTIWQRLRNVVRVGPFQTDNKDNHHPHRGWRKAVIVAAATTGTVALINIILMVVAARSFPLNDRGLITLRDGDCAVIKRINVILHLIINILSTALLGASSYTMQCLSSPTRTEVDAAHAKGTSLYVGVPNVRNLFHIKSYKGILWVCLCLSTLPLHFLWNSAIFSTGASNLFTYVIANEGFLTGAPYTTPDLNLTACNASTTPASLIEDIYDGYRESRYTNLSISSCFSRYSGGGGSDSRNLILITDTSNDKRMSFCGYGGARWNGSSIMAIGNDLSVGNDWSNRSAARFPSPEQDTDYYNTTHLFDEATGVWRFGSYPIKYCLSETVSASHCRLEYAPFILYVVVICNLIKFACMSITVIFVWNMKTPILATVGDAVASFLDIRDETTTGMCLLDSERLGNLYESQKKRDTNPSVLYEGYSKGGLNEYTRKEAGRFVPGFSGPWAVASSGAFYAFWSMGSIATAICTSSSFGDQGPMHMKFGAVNANALLGVGGDSKATLFRQIVLANSFQFMFSIVYFLYNSMFTTQCCAIEWAQFAKREVRPLRVTWPRGQQRSTYFLHLPWRYSIPLTVLQILMHFFISQSVFLARLVYFDSAGKPIPIEEMGFLSVGYSPPAILTTYISWTIVVLALAFHSFRTINNRIPPHGNLSMVISAICHADEHDKNDNRKVAVSSNEPQLLSTRNLMWGVTTEPQEIHEVSEPGHTETHHFPGHCTFTDRFVDLPQNGKLYN